MDKNFKLSPLKYNPREWVIVGGILLPVSSLPSKPDNSDLKRESMTYVTFQELFPSEENSEQLIKDGFGRFWLRDIIQVLAKIGYAASPFYYKATMEDRKIMSGFFEIGKFDPFSNQDEPRKILIRQQILANLRAAFLYSKDDENKEKVLGNEKDFGKLTFRITDFLEEEDGTDLLKIPRDQAKKRLYLTMARGMVFNEPETFALTLTRYWYIFNKIAYAEKHKSFKLKGRFRKATGTDFDYMGAVGFASWGFYSQPEMQKRLSQPNEFIFNRQYFKNTNENTRRKLLRALKVLSGDFDYFKTEFAKQKGGIGQHYAFMPFFRKPILRQAQDAFYLLDLKYLEDRISIGAFWYIYDQAIADGNAKFIKGKWGNIFEDYVNFLVKNTFPGQPKRVFSEMDEDNTGNVDLIIYYPDTLFLIEITTKQVPYQQWIECNEAKIAETLKRILIKDNRNNGKAAKLYEAIEKLKKGDLKLDGVDLTKIKNFIPIILFEKAPPMQNRLWQLYDDLLQANGIKNRKFLDDLDFWDIEEFEFVLADIVKGKSLPEILKEKEDAGFFKASMRNFYMIHRKHFDKHPILDKAFKTMSEQHKKILFKKENNEKV